MLSDDYMTMPLADMPHLHSLLTLVDGRIVYADGPYRHLDPMQH